MEENDIELARTLRQQCPAEDQRAQFLLQQVRNVRSWNKTWRWEFSEEQFAQAEAEATWPMDYPNAVPVLVPYTDHVGYPDENFIALWKVIETIYPRTYISHLLTFRLFYIYLRDSRVDYNVPTLRWELIELEANPNRADLMVTNDVFRHEHPDLPHAGVLAAIAHFPGYYQRSRPAIWAGGYATRTTGYEGDAAIGLWWEDKRGLVAEAFLTPEALRKPFVVPGWAIFNPEIVY